MSETRHSYAQISLGESVSIVFSDGECKYATCPWKCFFFFKNQFYCVILLDKAAMMLSSRSLQAHVLLRVSAGSRGTFGLNRSVTCTLHSTVCMSTDTFHCPTLAKCLFFLRNQFFHCKKGLYLLTVSRCFLLVKNQSILLKKFGTGMKLAHVHNIFFEISQHCALYSRFL